MQRGDLKYLWSHDQLNQQRNRQAAFAGFEEGPLSFDPTYKYDNGTNVYDTSEKARVPSWTDRILYMGYGLQLMEYARAECLMSDHRPGGYLCFKNSKYLLEKIACFADLGFVSSSRF
jgi:hypothetical protein